MKVLKATLLTFWFIAVGLNLSAQTLPLGLLSNTDDYVRRQQLLGNGALNRSYSVRPLYLTSKDSLGLNIDSNLSTFGRKEIWSAAQQKFQLYALPLVWQQQYNSHHPYGTNDGAMIPAKGYQTFLAAGLYMKAGPLSVQFRPEYVFAQDSSYPILTDYDQPASLVSAYYNYLNYVDAPIEYSEGTYSRFNLGQSSVRLHVGAASLGLSNENLWWGPGRYNSLLMTNNAEGFKHFTLNTTRPVQTGIGSFEGQLIAGRLDQSNGLIPKTNRLTEKSSNWRYINGMTISYQPKWVPGLFIGLNRSFTTYRKDMGSSLNYYLPVFTFLTKAAFAEDSHSNTEDGKNRDQIISTYMRWVWPESKSEIYFEWGREDHSWNLRDAFLEPEHTRAYVVGFNKLLPFKQRADEFIQVGVEFTQMEQSNSNKVRAAGTWYSHSQIRQGYTHRGQFLGAGNGPDNMQILDIAWVKQLNRIGLKMERRVHDNNLYNAAFTATKDSRRHWVDLSFIGQFDYSFKRFTLNSQMGIIRAMNYQYYLPPPPNGEYWYGDKNDISNFHVKIGLMYRL